MMFPLNGLSKWNSALSRSSEEEAARVHLLELVFQQLDSTQHIFSSSLSSHVEPFRLTSDSEQEAEKTIRR